MTTVAQRRDLAGLVKRVYIHPYLLESLGATDHPREGFNPSCRREYITDKEACLELRAFAASIRVAKPRKPRTGDFLSLLLAALPNLDRCSFQLAPYNDDIVRAARLSAAGVTELPLRTLDISQRTGWIQSDSLSFENCVRALFNVAFHLETLNLHACHVVQPKTYAPFLANLKYLRMTLDRSPSSRLEVLLSSCTSLRSFTYESAVYQYSTYRSEENFRLHHAVEYLHHSRETLESVHLDLRLRGRPRPGTHEPATAIPSFRNFPAMKKLLVNLQEFKTLPLADVKILPEFLPPNIGFLQLPGEIDECHVDRPREREIPVLSGLAEAIAQGGFPKLKEIQCDDFLGPPDVEVITSRLAAVGVAVGYRTWPSTTFTLDDTKWSDLPTMFSPPAGYENEIGYSIPFPDENEPDL
ncbi:hypothetical protein ASPCAL06260 [Aspergillus calidoustus]|uniref:F-box domain protein n=1 Tax=Aspergillus calidoustus TaxID=454130 RepID=A0A0U5GVY9_ASPCI|nr:hypothetical protein ASPCAL06260 [Aspergillus calidoustus]